MTDANLNAHFQGGLVPTWLADFVREPEQAVGSLLAGAMPLDHLAAAEPSLLLFDWLGMLAEDSGFPRALDEALASWIDAQWGDSLAVGGSAGLTAVAWTRACEVIAYAPQLTDAAAQLRLRVSADRAFLRDLSEGRSRDPEGLAWFALGRTQTDDRLLQDWWRLCNLDPGVPWYHGQYGVSGLAGLPEAARKGQLLQLCGNGLARLALALSGRVDEGWLLERVAREEFQRTARLFMDSVPFPEKWGEFWRQALRNRQLAQVPAESWVQGLFSGGLQRSSPSRDGRQIWFLPDPDWADRARHIRGKLPDGADRTLKAAEDLLAEQHKYGEHTGDWGFFVKSACNFAAKVRRTLPTRAEEWARAALRVEPSNPYTWTTLAECLVELDRLREAENIYLEANERFPNDAYTHTGLGKTLLARNRLEEAEAVYREARKRFPNDAYTHTGLGETLLAQNKLEEAEAIYGEARKRFSNNAVAHNGLGKTLLAQGRLEEAEAVYREACTRFPQSAHAGTGLEKVSSLLAGIAAPLEERPPQTISAADEDQESSVDEVADDTHPPYKPPTSADAEQPSSSTVRQEDFEVAASETARPAGRVRDFRAQDLETLLSEAAFVRRLGRLIGWSGEGEGSRIIRERVRDLLGRIPADARQLGSEGSANVALMRLDEDELDEALLLLREAVKRFPANVRVQYALARAQREAAEVERKKLDRESVAEIVKPWRRLSRLDQRMAPVSWLGEARMLFAHVDGATLERGARDVLGKLARWTSEQQPQEEREDSGWTPTARTQTKPLAEWWSGQLRGHLFPSGEKSAADIVDVGPLRSALGERSKLFDSLEESWVRSVSPTTWTLPPNFPGS